MGRTEGAMANRLRGCVSVRVCGCVYEWKCVCVPMRVSAYVFVYMRMGVDAGVSAYRHVCMFDA